MKPHELEHLWDTLEYLSNQQPKSAKNGRSRWQEDFYDKAKAGHGDYGIVQEPCVVHLREYDIAAWLWQEGSDWTN